MYRTCEDKNKWWIKENKADKTQYVFTDTKSYTESKDDDADRWTMTGYLYGLECGAGTNGNGPGRGNSWERSRTIQRKP